MNIYAVRIAPKNSLNLKLVIRRRIQLIFHQEMTRKSRHQKSVIHNEDLIIDFFFPCFLFNFQFHLIWMNCVGVYLGERKLFGGYRITPKFCKPSKILPKGDPRADGPTICMFNHECSQRHGEVVGACMDG